MSIFHFSNIPFKDSPGFTEVKLLIKYQNGKDSFHDMSLSKDEWVADISTSESIAHYGFVLDNTYWLCDPQRKVVHINESMFSLYNVELFENKNIKVAKSFFYKDVDNLQRPINSTKSFHSVDKKICYSADLENFDNDGMLFFTIQAPDHTFQQPLIFIRKLTHCLLMEFGH